MPDPRGRWGNYAVASAIVRMGVSCGNWNANRGLAG